MKFDHIGLITDERQANEDWVEATKVWVTNPKTHPLGVEWLRFEPDTPVTGPVRDKPHVAYQVENLDEASKGMKVLLEPFWANEKLRVGFFEYTDGSVVEFMEYTGSADEWFGKSESED